MLALDVEQIHGHSLVICRTDLFFASFLPPSRTK